CQQDFDWPPTF
nr:immunoglobulin light chain junction region [Macaca mulatta]MOV77663.1 immunoglobulin light chain junction region [Macaca mulatta]MOV77785.1 immunoglobulin light chain junction region [Macaca mulatta]MOV77934.1 immunoglobulin light chain junction region [Macaca mulatta]MOV77951.1 immunoglobulin light chain junction region [Macaca mulatta]